MSEGFIRHLVAALGTIVCLMIYWVGYATGLRGWWWASISVFVIYFILYHLIEA